MLSSNVLKKRVPPWPKRLKVFLVKTGPFRSLGMLSSNVLKKGTPPSWSKRLKSTFQSKRVLLGHVERFQAMF